MVRRTTSIDFETIRNGLVAWAANASGGLPVIFENSDAPRPTRPYVTLKIVTASIKSGFDDFTNVLDNTFRISGQRKMLVSVKVYHEKTKELEGLQIADALQCSLEAPAHVQQLSAAGLAVWSVGDVVDISALLETGFEVRYQIDLSFGLLATFNVDAGQIDSTLIEGEVKDEEGNTAVTFSGLIEAP